MKMSTQTSKHSVLTRTDSPLKTKEEEEEEEDAEAEEEEEEEEGEEEEEEPEGSNYTIFFFIQAFHLRDEKCQEWH